MQRISVTLPDEIIDRFYKKVGKGGRSKFIAKALEDALKKEEKLKAFQSLVQFKPFSVSRDSTEVLREIRNRHPEN